MIRTVFLSATVAAALAVVPTAEAQQQLDRNQIISSLYQTEATVGRLDPAALQRAAEAAAARGGGNASGRLSDDLRRYPQLSVEINFDRGSARIRPESYRSIGLIADALHHPFLMSARLVVVGHTDATGSRALNLDLSKRRAASVHAALTTTFNVPPQQLVSIGLGEEQLLDPSNPNSGVNRRVQLINLGE